MDYAKFFTIFGLPQRMILHVYRVSGIAHSQHMFFWEDFRAAHPDIEMSAENLRTMFLNDVIDDEEHYKYLKDEVIRYFNPTFYQQKLGSLDDPTESDDFLLDVPKHADTGNQNFEEMDEYVNGKFDMVLSGLLSTKENPDR
ncbi:uncharacterized protein LOC129718885 [Wyeomyia smithii]|uniref:uncharacterized protein LOC129718885 n=1 Tax=Wyeomyia smithii TaxID=174621 RepID=UPI0024680E05|nr:uncharacterized protein LOC129718885 [Wyeomyia smithii]